ncbi:MAG: TMEM43 family protein, partial [Candidatus Marithrix sp.]|nr:TMEM43 family protein [Candidatus Marithrix sp.]
MTYKITTDFYQRLQQSRMVALLITIIGLFLGLWLGINAVTDLMQLEEEAIFQAKTLTEGRSVVISVDADQIEMGNENKLIHITGETTVDEIIMDELFQVEVVNVIKLYRTVQMYQWQEDSDKNYKKVWSEQFINSKKFVSPEQYYNPAMPFTSKIMVAKQVILGDFIIPNTFPNKMEHYQKLPMRGLWREQDNLRKLFPNQQINFIDGTYYIGKNSKQPKVGDLKLSFAAVLPEDVSIIAKQSSQLTHYTTKAGGNIELFEYGIVTSERMFRNARTTLFAKNLRPRLKNILAIFIGTYIIFHIVWIASPSLLNPDKFQGWLIALIISVALALAIIAFSWRDYNLIV